MGDERWHANHRMVTPRFTIRDARLRDLDHVLALNQANVPHVGVLTREALCALHKMAACSWIAVEGDEVVGFLLAMTPEAPYASPNFTWFRDRYSTFLYIDRVAVDARHHRKGIASA